VDQIHHVAIVVKDIAETVDFYRKTFSCEIAYQDKTWALLQFANIHLALVLPEQHPPHIGIVKDNAKAFGPLKRHRDGTESVYIPDVAGNMVEILEATSLPAKTI